MVDLAAFVPACLALNLAFGPNNLLSVTYGAHNGVGFALAAGLARLTAFIPMILASALGLGLLLATSAVLFTVLKVLGAVYLIYLGLKLICQGARPAASEHAVEKLALRTALRNEGLVALSNPKAILIFTAFFPQFVQTDAYWPSYATLAAVFLLLETFAILVYGSLGRFAGSFARARRHLFQRASGIAMIAFGVALLTVRHSTRPA